MNTGITIKNIAQYLGYSTSTISKAINDSPEISIVTKNRILKYVKSKGYKPNIHALSLRHKKSNILGIILPDFKDLFFSRFSRRNYRRIYQIQLQNNGLSNLQST